MHDLTPDQLTAAGAAYLPGFLGVRITGISTGTISAEMAVKPQLLAPNGYLHAGSIVTLADSCCGYGCMTNLPQGAHSFTTIELKSNHLGTARDGLVRCVATLVHGGRTTQVWDALVQDEAGKTLAMFRCTQMVLYPKP